MGIDTVKLGGEGFSVMVSEGQKVTRGDVIMQADIKLIKEKGFDTTVVVVKVS